MLQMSRHSRSLGPNYGTFFNSTVLLRDRPTFLEEVRQGKKIESKILSLLVVSSLFFCYLWGHD